ncbi:MAG: PSD1 and planctomycete cytochrome C domain-containing protein [Planctomycetales bacterium]
MQAVPPRRPAIVSHPLTVYKRTTRIDAFRAAGNSILEASQTLKDMKPTVYLLGLLGLIAGAVVAGEPLPAVDYIRDVRPILARYCFACHGPDEAARKADLRLDDREWATRELPTGSRAIVPGRTDESELIARLNTDEENLAMPPRKFGKSPTAAERDTLKAWIEQDARYARHWAYIKPVRPAQPAVSDPTWPINPIDSFVMARLDREGLRPQRAADRHALLRRASLDLTGLPPSLEEAEQFANDPRPDAYELAVDRLLARSTYGERWGAVWLDLARYGDSQGYIHDPPRTIWRWRDWLIEALNDNRPYDRFSTEMLAGDLLPGATPSQMIATGFHRNTTNNTEGGANSEEYRHASVVDRVNTTMQVWMGSTVACAQCHTHKYDPFTQKEYYQIFAIFNGTEDNNSENPIFETAYVGLEAERAARLDRLAAAKQRLDAEVKTIDAQQPEWEDSFDRAGLPQALGDIISLPPEKRNPAQTEQLANYHRAQFPEWRAASAAVAAAQADLDKVATTTLVMKEIAPRPTHVAIRGEYNNKGDPVSPGVPAALHPVPSGVKLDRLGLAQWLFDPDNPLTARVAVNRLWQEIFGIGLVETAEEFGNQGDPPSHPELLDWLAVEFAAPTPAFTPPPEFASPPQAPSPPLSKGRQGGSRGTGGAPGQEGSPGGENQASSPPPSTNQPASGPTPWDVKRLLKLMVTSATYRQSSLLSGDLAQRDPLNRLLARGPRIRLPAETVRDQALFVAGLLSPKMYGPPVHPPQPVNGLAAAFGPSTDWTNSAGEDGHRRALYTRWRRNLPYPSMITFDAPERSVCSMRRIRTNTPLQALVTLNDPVYVEAAQGLARRIVSEGGSDRRTQAEFAFRLALTRPPADYEIDRIVSLFEAARASLALDLAKATALATKPIGPVPAGGDVTDAAAWTVVGNVLLNLDEFLAKR